MSKLVLEITSHAGDGGVLHRTLEKFPATLGRGYHNDIILSDPHISPQHLRFDAGADGWSLLDLGSENGLIVNDRIYRASQVRLNSGDVIRIGHTEIRAYDPQHPVAATQRLQKTSQLLVWLARPLHVWTSFLLALGVTAGYAYFEVWDEEATRQLTYAAAATLGFIFIWSALWAVAGKLIQHKSRFRSHVALISLAIVADFSVISYIESYTEYLASQNWLAMGVSYALTLLLLMGLVYGCLALATGMPQRRRFNAAAYFSIGLLAGAWTLSQVAEMHFSPEPKYPAHLRPYLSSLAPTDSLVVFTDSNRKLFDSSALKVTDQIKKAE